MIKIDTTELGIEQHNAGEPISPEYISKREISAANVEEYHIHFYHQF